MKKNMFLTLLLAVFVFCACSNEIEPVLTLDAKSELSVAKGLNFLSESSDETLRFTTNKEWEIVASETKASTWYAVSPMSGKGGEITVKIHADENRGYEDRSVVLTLRTGNLEKKIVVSQKQKNAITLTQSKFEVPQSGGQVDVEVLANVDYTVEIPEAYKEWITLAKTRGLAASHLAFTIARSEVYEKREGEIIIKGNGLQEVLKVYQAGGGILVLSDNKLEVGDQVNQFTVELGSNFDYSMRIEGEWLTEVVTRAMSSHTLHFQCEANPTYEARVGRIIFYDKQSTLENVVEVKQLQKDAVMASQKEFNLGYQSTTLPIDLQANVDFDVQIPEGCGWLHKMPLTRGLTAHSFSFSVDENRTPDVREVILTFTHPEKGEMERVKVIQKPLYLDLTEHAVSIIATCNKQLAYLDSPYIKEVSLKWHSSDEAVATVSETGLVSALAPGHAVITATTSDGKYTDACEVTVADITAFVQVYFSSSSTVNINGYITGNIYSTISNGSSEEISLTALRIYDGESGLLVGENQITPNESLQAGISTNLGMRLRSVYAPIYKWCFTFKGKEYVVQHQFPIGS